MTERSVTQHPVERGPVAGLFSGTLKFIFFLVIALVFSILVEWIGLTFFWADEGQQHSALMLTQEIEYLNQDFTRSVLVQQPAHFAAHTADLFHDTVFRKSGIERGLLWLASPSDEPSRVRVRLRDAYELVAEYAIATMTVTQVFAVRVAILILAMSAFVLLGLVGLTDGLVQRDLRRWGGGRESAFVYHWAKRTVDKVFVSTQAKVKALLLSDNRENKSFDGRK